VLLEAIDELTATVLALMILFAFVHVTVLLIRGGLAVRTDLSDVHPHGVLPVLRQRFEPPEHGMRWPAVQEQPYQSRSIPMNDVLTSTWEEVRIKSTARGSVFCNRTGAPYRSFRTAFENAVRKAHILDFTFHDLRHTFASRLVMAGVDLPTVKELMGHKNISMTLRYTHLSSDHKQ